LVAPEQSRAARIRALRPTDEPGTIVLVVSGRFSRADVAALDARARGLLEGGGDHAVVCDVGAVMDPDAVTVDALARLQLIARRLGHQVLLRGACAELRDLLALAGLCGVLPPCAELGLEPGRQTEEREQAGGVEEEDDPGDPAP
jgi:anti-anti-sigma regulatory factor